MPQLTEQEKLSKKQRDNLKLLHNRLTGAWSLHQLTKWGDVYRHIGWTDDYIASHPALPSVLGVLTYPELKAFLAKQTEELEQRIKERHDNATVTPEKTGDKGQAGLQAKEEQPVSSATLHIQQQAAKGDSVATRAEPQAQAVIEPDEPTDHLNDNKDYGLTPSPNEKVYHFWFQKKAIAELCNKVTKERKRGVLLLASTGTGKTFMSGGFTRRLEDMVFHDGKTWSHIPYLYITRATIVEQTQRVFKNFYNLGVEQMEIINIEQLRSKAGRLWVREDMKVVNGQEMWEWSWKPNINPCVILWDECQALKNDTSTQHRIACAYNDLKTKETYQVFISATPFTRVSEAKCFAVATHRNIEHLGFPPGTIITNQTWPSYAQAIAGDQSKPDDYNEAAVERLMEDLKDYVVRVKGVRPQFEAHNTTNLISFETKEERDYYQGAWDRYLKEKAKIEAKLMAEGKSGSTGGISILVEFLKFRMAAEFTRKEWLAKHMYETVQLGKAACCALNFKGSIIGIVKILVEKYKVPRHLITLVWGGGQTQLTEKQKARQKIKLLASEGKFGDISEEEMLETTGLEEVEDRILEELDPSLRLGGQSQDERQLEIDKFQSGKSLYCLFTFRAGGVGLSLHHSDELTKQKVRRKESGYAVEEDIPSIPVRPRKCFVAPTYSAIELVQGLGRCPRLTSLSDTEQVLVFYRGTIEQDVKAIVDKKLRCLSKVVKMRESWQDVVIDSANSSKRTQDHIDAVPDDNTNNGNDQLESGEEE